MVTPTDPLYREQWHFGLIGDIETVWNDFTGAGVVVGVFDGGIQSSHPDLQGNYDPSLHLVLGTPQTPPVNEHGTSVAGLIAAVQGNGQGGVGVAWDATISAVEVFENDLIPVFRHMREFDITSNSWNWFPEFSPRLDIGNRVSQLAALDRELAVAARDGRDGLGTIVVNAAGNATANAGGSGFNVSRYTITVAATERDGFAAYYTNFGPNILVAAPAASVTTDLLGTPGYNNAVDPLPDLSYTSVFGGTSAAAPLVSGVVALMLEAAPGLGWRDVHKILSISAAHTGSPVDGESRSATEILPWVVLPGSTWNGGGGIYNGSYGFGMIDAHAAVRMAEAWLTMNDRAATSANEVVRFASYTGPDVTIRQPPNPGSFAVTEIQILSPVQMILETVHVTVTLTHRDASDLALALIAPDGTVVPLMAQGTLLDWQADSGWTWTFGIQALRGFDSEGVWTLRVTDGERLDGGRIADFRLSFHGGLRDNDTLHTVTDDFLMMASANPAAGRTVFEDLDRGRDWLNMAAVTGDIQGSLGANGAFTVDGTSWFTLRQAVDFENIFTGDGNDRIVGNGGGNQINGGRGNDSLNGLGGNDRLFGGAGSDLLAGGNGHDRLEGGDGNDTLNGSNGTDVLIGGAGNDLLTGGGGTDTFVFSDGGGVDRVRDFVDDIDQLSLHEDLWGGGLDVARVIDRFARDQATSVLFDFGGGDRLIVVGVNDRLALLDDIVILTDSLFA